MSRPMTVRLAAVSFFAGWTWAAGQEVTPVNKVIQLLDELKADCEKEGREEAKAYNTFACWCQDSTKSRSEAILGGRDSINTLSATIAEKTALKLEKEAELKQRKVDHEQMTAELQDTTERYQQAEAKYTAEEADLSKAIRSLEDAIQAMEDSKPVTSLLAIRSTVEESLALASVMNLISEPKRKAVSAFLQVDPNSPEYAFHSQGIIDVMNKLLEEFRQEKLTLDTEWGKSKALFEQTIVELKDKLEKNQSAMNILEDDIQSLTRDIATTRQSLVSAEAMLKDDQLYMKDMTERCEVRAKDWDQRSKLRSDELEVLTQALEILRGTVSEKDILANKRALIQEHVQKVGESRSLASVARHGAAAAAPVLLQEVADVRAAGGRARGGLRGAAAAQARKSAAAVLDSVGRRIGSTALSALAAHVSEGPFDKVKVLIQDLIERLLREATEEATKKGFCDEELGKAKTDRDFRSAESTKLDIEIQSLNLKRQELEEEITLLSDAISKLESDLLLATKAREAEHKVNLETIKDAQEGFKAVKEAIVILKEFYTKSARAVVLTQFSPIDESAEARPGFEGVYKGQQVRSEGIIGLLEVIATDFDRTDRQTTAAEQKAHEEFVEFDRASRADIAGKETKKALDEEDHATTVATIATKMDDLRTAQALLDAALRRLLELKPMCIDSGMSYEERVEKREQEMEALKKALCILNVGNAEPEYCPQVTL